MKTLPILATIAAATLSLGLAAAPPGPGASAPGGGMGPGGGHGGMRFGAGITPGWSMMTPDERAAHQKAMGDAKTVEDCGAVRDQHHQQMIERAKQRGQAVPAQPRRDICAGLKK